jgi:thioredoxin-dependent peroxiredoxin
VIAVGDPAPDFTLATDAGEPLSLASLRGRPVVLYFYPKDDTPGCTMQACDLRDVFPRIDAEGAVVLGVSPDTPEKHRKFKHRWGLPFTLLADTDHAVAERYGVWKLKSLFGLKYWGNERTTFVIDRDGRVARVFEKVRVRGHAEAVEAALRAL